jgi:hypothetical protein
MSKKIQSRGRVKPAPISSQAVGLNNQLFAAGNTAIVEGNTYRDLSTICFVPSLGSIPVRVVQAWNSLLKPMNQKWGQIFIVRQEVGVAYEEMVNILRGNSDLQKFRYTLTMEEDNCPPADGLLKLYEDIESGPFDAVGSLYWTKGHGSGKPMCYGRVDVTPKDFVPWLPPPNSVTQCHGLGMGMSLFRTKMFLDTKFERPIFKTEQSVMPGGGGTRQFTQDLRFFENAGKLGYRVACSTRVLTGHYSRDTDEMF